MNSTPLKNDESILYAFAAKTFIQYVTSLLVTTGRQVSHQWIKLSTKNVWGENNKRPKRIRVHGFLCFCSFDITFFCLLKGFGILEGCGWNRTKHELRRATNGTNRSTPKVSMTVHLTVGLKMWERKKGGKREKEDLLV